MQMGPEVAAERLRTALAEQARLSDAYARATGTPGELASRMRLQASNLQVAVCERLVNGRHNSRRPTAGA